MASTVSFPVSLPMPVGQGGMGRVGHTGRGVSTLWTQSPQEQASSTRERPAQGSLSCTSH